MSCTLADFGWLKIMFTTYHNYGLGILYAPARNQVGLLFLVFSLVFVWDDAEQDDDVTVGDLYPEGAQ